MENNLFHGDRMRSLRQRAKMSQEELARIVNVSRTQIVNLELGGSEPSLNSLVNIAVALKTTTDYLLGIESRKFAKPLDEPLPFE